jgi:excisionase family DNA binding protein
MNDTLVVFSDAFKALVEELVDQCFERRFAVRETVERGPTYLTVAEAAERLRTKRQRVYDLLSDGRLTRFKDGSRVLIRADEIDEYLTTHAATSDRRLRGKRAGHSLR